MKIIETYTKTLQIVILQQHAMVPGDPHQVFTLISRDGIHQQHTDIAAMRKYCDWSNAVRIAEIRNCHD